MTFTKKLKDSTSGNFKKAFNLLSKDSHDRDEFKEKAEEAIDGISEDFDAIKDNVEIKFDLLKKLSTKQLSSVKQEALDLKQIMQSKELVIYQSEAFAVVLRKLGGLNQFLQTVDKLTQEGFRLVLKEEVRDIPIPAIGLKFPLGTFYLFQNSKYLLNSNNSLID